MKHQISLVGGQLLPIYVGIKEFNPDKIHFIVSKESVTSLNNLKPIIKGIPFNEYQCNPFDFYDKTIDAIYKVYQLPESNPGYPSKTERKQMAIAVKQKTSELYLAFQKSILLKEEKKYDEAMQLLEEINTYFPSRENYNNLGVIKTLSALDLKVLTLEEHKYPKRFLYPLELDNSSRLNQNGTRGAEADQAKMVQLLKSAQKDFEKAMVWIEKAISLNPKEAFYFNNRGLYHLYLGEYEKGLEDINYSLKQNPKNLYAIRNKGIYYFYKGQKDLALTYFDEVDKKDPDMEMVKEYISKCNQD